MTRLVCLLLFFTACIFTFAGVLGVPVSQCFFFVSWHWPLHHYDDVNVSRLPVFSFFSALVVALKVLWHLDINQSGSLRLKHNL